MAAVASATGLLSVLTYSAHFIFYDIRTSLRLYLTLLLSPESAPVTATTPLWCPYYTAITSAWSGIGAL